MALGEFLFDETTGGGGGSWADDMDDLPTAPVAREGGARRGGDYLSSAPDRGPRGSSGFGGGGYGRDYPSREEVPLPTKPPFTAFIGNLSFDLVEDEVREIFAPSQVVSVRILTDHEGKPKGFGYVEFETLDELKDAIAKTGTEVGGRTIRVGPAEPPKSGGGGFSSGPSAAEEASQWRRSGPLPPAPNGVSRDGPPRRGTSFVAGEGSGGGFDNMDVSGGARSGFGSKFAPSGPGPAGPRGGFGGPGGPGGLREDGPRSREPLEPGPGEVASDWRTGKPVESAPTGPKGGPGGPRGGPPFQRRDTGEAEERFAGQERMGFGSKFEPAAPVPEQPRGFGFGGDRKQGGAGGSPVPGPSDEADTWRSARQPGGLAPSGTPRGRQGSGSVDRAGASGSPAAAPLERKKLELAPRSASAQPVGNNDTPAASTSNKPSPFGNAKPVNAAEREREIEERMKEREKERKEKDVAAKAAAAAAAAARAEKPVGSPVTAAPQGPASATGSESSPAIPTGPAADAAKPKPAGPPPNAWGRKKEFAKTASPSPSRSPAASTPGTSPRPVAAAVPGKAQSQASSAAKPTAQPPTTPAAKPAPSAAAPASAAPPTAPKAPSTGAWGRGRAAGGALRSAPTSGTTTSNGSSASGKAEQEAQKQTEGTGEGAPSIVEMAKDAAGQVKDKVTEVVEGVKVLTVGTETENASAKAGTA